MMFVSEQRKLVKAGKITVPGNTLGQRSKFYGKQWKSLTTEDKKVITFYKILSIRKFHKFYF